MTTYVKVLQPDFPACHGELKEPFPGKLLLSEIFVIVTEEEMKVFIILKFTF